jgi:IS4 transposase
MAQVLSKDKDIIDFNCYVHTEKKKYIPVRIVAGRIPADKTEAVLNRKKRDAQKRQYTPKAETFIFAQWVILMTSLDSNEYSAAELLEIYRCRWQVELLFKRIKQHFKINRLRKATLPHSKVLVLAWLIQWALVERESYVAEVYLINKNKSLQNYSPWALCDFFSHTLASEFYMILALSIELSGDLFEALRRLKSHTSTRFYQFDALYSAPDVG